MKKSFFYILIKQNQLQNIQIFIFVEATANVEKIWVLLVIHMQDFMDAIHSFQIGDAPVTIQHSGMDQLVVILLRNLVKIFLKSIIINYQVTRYDHQATCSNDCECKMNLGLRCITDSNPCYSFTGTSCVCPSSQYWTGSICSKIQNFFLTFTHIS